MTPQINIHDNNNNNNNEDDDDGELALRRASEPLLNPHHHHHLHHQSGVMMTMNGHTTTTSSSLPFRRGQRESARNATASPRPTQYRSLARSPTTPCLATCLIPLLTITAHVLFYYGQTAPMWRMHLSQHIDVWANASSTQSKWACDTIGLPHANHIVMDHDKDLRTFTYGFAIHELWKAKMIGLRVLPRLTAVLLVFCSGLWPHLKLFLLNLTFLFPMRNLVRRKRFLHWLSALGKWSLADVFAVCVMVAVLNLNWHVDPEEIKSGIITEMPTLIKLISQMYTANDLCSKMLKYDCSHPKIIAHVTKCKACKSLVYEAYTHPSWAQSTGKSLLQDMKTSGGGETQLSIIGMRGIYSFCLAIILSIVLSLIVDIFDTRARRFVVRWQEEQQHQQQQQQQAVRPALAAAEDVCDDNDPTVPLLLDAPLEVTEPSSTTMSESLEDTTTGSHNDQNNGNGSDSPVAFVYEQPPEDGASLTWYHYLLPPVTAVIVLLATQTATMTRHAEGAIPSLLQDILGVSWQKPYSFFTLMEITGAAGGWDFLLMGTFALFIVIGPIVRSALCILALSQAIPANCRPFLASAIDFVGAFCAWEVLAVAVFMVDMQMPAITDTIVRKAQCALISADGSCFKVSFDISRTFLLIVGGGLLLVGTSALAVIVGRKQEALQDAARRRARAARVEPDGDDLPPPPPQFPPVPQHHPYERLPGSEDTTRNNIRVADV